MRTSTGSFGAASALLAVDQNRSAIVERVVAQWGELLARSTAGMDVAQLRTLLSGLRADHLLAASLAGTLDGLRDVIANAMVSTAAPKPGLLQTKAFGDANDDLVYTPVTPCRLADTRVAGGALGANSSRDFKVWVSSGGFAPQGGDAGNCNVPANPAAVVLNLAAVNPQGTGNLIVYPTGAALPNTSALNYQIGTFALSNGATIPACTPNCANQITVRTNGAGVDVILDVVGYFASAMVTAFPSTIVWVAPPGGGTTYTSVQAAINVAASVASASHPYLVKVAPGTYTEQITLKDFVDVEGSGENVTLIQYGAASPTVLAGAQSEVRNLSIVNTNNAAFPGAIAVSQSANTANGFTTLYQVAAVADGPADNLAVYATGGAMRIFGADLEAAPSGTQTGTEVGLWATGATTDAFVKNSKLAASSGATRQSAHRESSALVRIENTQLKGTTFGTPFCFATFNGADLSAAACP